MKKLTLLTASLLFALLSFAQKEANFWYFGFNAGLNFGLGLPVAVTNGQLNTWEGCSSISSSNGDLLFYTDGQFVYNANHQEMPNGNGLMGDESSTQSGIIVPKPGSNSEYYIFTVDDLAGPSGVRYSLVDMTLNGGLGDVVPSEKNVPLVAPTCEKITAVGHGNGTDYWMITHLWNSDQFYAYLVTSGGVSSTPVISTVGPIIGGDTENSKGYMKFSPNGAKLALANNLAFTVDIFDFNNNSGQVSNHLQDANYVNPGAQGGPYGVGFSPDSKLLYISEWKDGKRIYQYDLTAGSGTAILNSRVIVASAGQTDNSFGALQLGPDNRLYIARWQDVPYLSVFTNPTVYGPGCNYVQEGVNLGGQGSGYGLPPFIQSFFNLNTDILYDIPVCLGDSTQFYTSTAVPPDSVRWDFGDPASGPENTSTELNPKHLFTNTGIFAVTLTLYVQLQSDVKAKLVIVNEKPDVDLGEDISQCTGSSITLDAGAGFEEYVWSTGETSQSIEVTTSGEYWVQVFGDGNCSDFDTVDVTIFPAYEFTEEESICEGDSIFVGGDWQKLPGAYTDTYQTAQGCDSVYITNLTVYDTFNIVEAVYLCEGDSTFVGGQWQKVSGIFYDTLNTIDGCDSVIITDLTVSDNVLVNEAMTICMGDSAFLEGGWQQAAGTFYDTVSDPTTCDSIFITQLSVADTFRIDGTAAICDGDSILLGGNWQKQAGVYTDNYLTVLGCDSTVVTELIILEAVYGSDDIAICEGDSVWLEGAWRKTPGTYTDLYTAVNSCDSIVNTTLTVNDVFYSETDTLICEGDSVYLGGSFRTQEGVYEDNYFTQSGCDSIISTELYIESQPSVSLGNDTTLQEGEELFLDAFYPDATYLWQDGTTAESFLVRDQGLYNVEVTTNCGTATDSIFVYFGDFFCDPFTPNAFTPDGDGLNDTFRPVLPCEIQDYRLLIYNRWGELIFETDDREESWDGKKNGQMVDQGTYTWVLFYTVGLYENISDRTARGVVVLMK